MKEFIIGVFAVLLMLGGVVVGRTMDPPCADAGRAALPGQVTYREGE